MNPPRKHSLLVDAVLLLALLLIAVVAYKLSPLLLPRADVTVDTADGCDLNRDVCSATLPGGGRVEIAIAPRPVPVIKPMRVEVLLSGLQAGRVEIDFAGATMNMGYNRPLLAAVAPGRYAGEATLPVCVTGQMEWLATLMIETDGARIAVPFRFRAPMDAG